MVEELANEMKSESVPNTPSTEAVSIGVAEQELRPEQSERKEGSAQEKFSELVEKSGLTNASTRVSDDDVTDDARNASLRADAESQVTHLLDLATEKGVVHAVKVAERLKNYYVLDRMHDDLVDRFYQGLVDKGFIKP